ncbi:MAG: choice-of-anchor tandem repeat GloVer-containing protein [Bryobacteraceae bacterium]|jgi:uncharacterized repeat protein (TIGR03803 family)
MKRSVNAPGKLSWAKKAYAVFVLSATTAVALPAQTFTTLFSFDSANGGYPRASLVQGTDGSLYGTTSIGGASYLGTIFKITQSGTLTKLYNFCSQTGCTDGASPFAGLVQATNGNLYGTTGGYGTGILYGGTVFKITPSGTLTTLHNFCAESGCTDGANPYAGLTQGTDGNLYGATYFGGTSNNGVVFKITPSGTLTTLYNFCVQSSCTDGKNPSAGLIQATNGDLYGTTWGGGAANGGTVFKITPTGTLTTLYNFCSQSGCADGEYPSSGLVQATNGELYGSTSYGGSGGLYGTVFKITPTGTLATLHSFLCAPSGACTDGYGPTAALIQATDGSLYGTTSRGGARYAGTVFRITPRGTLTTVYDFCSQIPCTDGYGPQGGLVQATNGEFYGTAFSGGAGGECTNGCGTVFSLSVGLSPFVKPQPASGKVGAVVRILGTDLTGTTSLTFNGMAAVFKVESASLILATVPTGATTGTIQVVTPSGTLSSNVAFRVVP